MKQLKRFWIVLGLLSIAGIGVQAYRVSRPDSGPLVRTTQISRGDIVDTVGATGTLQAVTTVQVGSQVSGNISWLGADFNSIVQEGPGDREAGSRRCSSRRSHQAQANLHAGAREPRQGAGDVERAKVALTDAQQKFTRARRSSPKQLLPQSDLDAAKVAVDTAQASSASSAGHGAVVAGAGRAGAGVAQPERRSTCDHTIITAPIDGIVIQRSVDVGQTVAASMQAPTLFVIAADLTKMQVSANIDEADIGRIRPGQHVTFKVDAYPTETFTGTVSQVRLQPVVVQNVTTYSAIIDVPNAELKLKPGMTANVSVEVARQNDVAPRARTRRCASGRRRRSSRRSIRKVPPMRSRAARESGATPTIGLNRCTCNWGFQMAPTRRW